MTRYPKTSTGYDRERKQRTWLRRTGNLSPSMMKKVAAWARVTGLDLDAMGPLSVEAYKSSDSGYEVGHGFSDHLPEFDQRKADDLDARLRDLKEQRWGDFLIELGSYYNQPKENK